jgi:hypothetical protein
LLYKVYTPQKERRLTTMESYVERWKREQEERKQKEQKEGVTDGRTDETQSEREGQKAQKHRRVSEKQCAELGESQGE